MRRRLLPLLLLTWLCLWSLPLRAQETTRIVLVEHAETGVPVPDVICSTWDSAHRRTSFTQSDQAGRAKLRISGRDRSVSFALLGFAKQELLVQDLRGEIPVIRLKPTTTRLREVYVKAEPITVRRDTLSYRVKAFAGNGDRYLEDVLKKLPGVKVHDDGRIEYQGKSINKFYIEGMDPLGMNYKQASRNIPTDAVDQVDVIQHNQHKRILQGKVFDEHPALNIRLNSKYRFRPFGEVAAGAGLPVGQGEGKAFLMQVGKGNQLITSIKANNTGANLLSDFTEPIDLLQLETYVFSPTPFLSPALGVQSPPLAERRFLDNRSLGWSVNDLQRLTEYASLRLQAKGYHDRQYRESEQHTDYFGEQPFHLSERSSLKTRPDRYRFGVHYELNAPRSFLLADLTAGYQRDVYGEQLQNAGKGYDLSLRQTPQWVNADIQGNVSLGRHLINLHTTGQLYTAPERLAGFVTDGGAIDEERKVSQLAIRNKASVSFHFRDATLRASFIADAEERSFAQVPASEPNTHFGQLELGPDVSFSLGLERFSLTLSSPFHLRRERLRLGQTLQEKTYLNVAPTLSISKTFSPKSRMTLYAGYSKTPDPDPYYLLGAPARRSYRMLYEGISRLSHTHSWRASTRYTYHDPTELFFTHFDLSYSRSRHDHYRDLSYTASESRSVPIDSVHYKQVYSAQLTIDKSIAPIGLSLRSELVYSGLQYLASLRHHTYPTQSQTLLARVRLGWSKIRWLDLSYQGNLSRSQLRIDRTTPPAVWYLGEELKAVFALSKQVNLTLRLEHTMNPTYRTGEYQHSFFCDAEATWTPKKRLLITLRATNLTGVRAYTATSLSGSQQVRYTLPLRGREVLLSCSFRL